MSFVDAVRHRLRVFRRGEEYARELDRETRFHLELERLAQSANGRPEHDAELAARRQFGNVTYYREETRRLSLLGSMDRVRQDVAYALRGLRRNSGFTVAVALTLGLGIGVNAAMFSLLERLFVRPAAGIGAPESLRRLYFDPGHSVTNRGSHVFASFNYPSYRALKAAYGNTEVAAYTPSDSVMMVVRADSVPAHVSFVTASYFTALRVRAPLGRTFGPDEDRIETPTPVAIISDALWRSVFRADPRVLGTSPRIDGTRYTIVGVAPREFDGVDLGRVDVWIPLSAMTSNGAPWYLGDANYLRVFVRPSPGERVERLAAIGSLTLRAVHNSMAGRRDTVSKMLMGPIVAALGPEEQDRNVSISAVLAGVSVIVLLIACANVINLMLLRSARRGREIAVRRAIGASALRLFSQFVTESLCLSLLGGAVALMLGLWGSAVLRRLLFPTIHWAAGSVDTRLMALVGAVTVGIAFVAGLAPALHGIPPNLASELRGG
ncbi:MAG TPA: ABC transporter permease, partial [Gemmatimonadaceae bacterium]|nr:ABC transporter permease [Gemmatimonadaceae bacterium]